MGPPVGRDSAEIISLLRARISTGEIGPGEFAPTVRALSQEYGVSRGTAWRALKALEAEGLISAQPRHGYRVLSRAGDPGQGAPLAYVLSREGPEESEPAVFYRQLEVTLRRVAGEKGWSMVALSAGKGQEKALFERLSGLRVCGLIMDAFSPTFIDGARKTGLPVVLVDSWRREVGFDAVVQDNFAGGQLAASYLLERGQRKVGWFGPIGEGHHSRERYGGAAAALAEAGLSFSNVTEADRLAPDLEEKAREFLSQKDRPDGVLALWLPVAEALAAAARSLGLKFGKDLEMVGWCAEEAYDPGFLAAMTGGPVPPAVVWSAAAMAETAVGRLAERRANPELPVIRMNVPLRLKRPDDV